MAIQRTTKNVSLTPELERLIESLVASGRYQSASEVIRAGLRLLEQSEGVNYSQVDDLERRRLAPR